MVRRSAAQFLAVAGLETNKLDPDDPPYDVHPDDFLAKLHLDSVPVVLLAANC
jgi:hypothetical protein